MYITRLLVQTIRQDHKDDPEIIVETTEFATPRNITSVARSARSYHADLSDAILLLTKS